MNNISNSDRATVLVQALPCIRDLYGKTVVIKYGGNAMVNEELKQAVRPDTLLISIMMVNNEVGAINPIDEIKAFVKKNTHALLHVDCVQAAGKIPLVFLSHLRFSCPNMF